MRPVKLVISAFGPYADMVEIDFEKLGTSGLYLICGNTGSGKSTIFDAIRFVLYGDASADIKTGEMLRSTYADENIKTYVHMDFLYRNEMYHIERNPKYRRRKGRGEGYTDQKADGYIELPDKTIISGYGNVTEKVSELLGINSDQFAQTVMIAQGKFRELLLADTASRSKIFRDIFKTAPYDELQKRIRRMCIEKESQYRELSRDLKRYIDDVKVADISEEYIYGDCDEKNRQWEDIRNRGTSDMEAVTDFIRQLISEDETMAGLTDRKLEELQNEVKKLDITIDRYKKNEELKSDLNKALESLGTLSEEEKKISVSLKQAEDDYKAAMVLREEIPKLKEVIPKCKEKENQRQKVEELNDKLNGQKKFLEETVNKRENSEKLLKECNEKITAYENIDVDILKIQQERERMEKFQKSLVETGKYISENILKDIEDYEVITKKYIAGKEKLKKVRTDVEKMEERFLDGQAGIMAEKLRSNPSMPCPVCGSTHYVKLAEYSEDIPSENQVEESKKVLNRKTEEVSQLSADAGNKKVLCRTEIRNLVEKLKGFPAECDKNDIFHIEVSKCVDDIWKAENDEQIITKSFVVKIKELCEKKAEETDGIIRNLVRTEEDRNKKRYEKEQLIRNIDKVSADIEKLKEEEERERLACYETEKELISAKNIFEHIDSELEVKDVKTAENRLKEIVSIVKESEECFETQKKMYDELKSRIDRNNGIVNALRDQVDGKTTDESYILMCTNREKIQEEIKIQQKYRESITVRLASNRDTLKKITVSSQSVKCRMEELAMIKELSDTLSGDIKLSSKEKVSLETFVQISYFENIIRKANVKLLKMTDGQYEFVRDKNISNKKSQVGLDLNVYDYYNGTQRSVKTLSGGETFLASLALALGMADIIEDCNTGIMIDTMFIDEGFGSLDDESLELVMRVLSNLSSGNKLVGIISHVAALKDRIDRQVIVNKTAAGGSCISII